MLKRIFLTFLIILLCAAAAGFFLWMTFLKGYPWWFAAAIILGVLGLWIGLVFILRRLRRKKEEEFVRRVIVQDEEAIKTASSDEKSTSWNFRKTGRPAVELLRSSYLRKRGNPLYALPWFIIIGESGSGKHPRSGTQSSIPARRHQPHRHIGHPQLRLVVLRRGDHPRHRRAIHHSHRRGPRQGGMGELPHAPRQISHAGAG